MTLAGTPLAGTPLARTPLARTPLARAALSLLVLCVLAFAPSAARGRTESSNAPGVLTGIKTVYVMVEDVPKQALDDGLDTSKLRTIVEEGLKRAGLGVATRSDYINAHGTMPLVYVNVTPLYLPKSEVYAYTAHLQVRETVSPIRDADVKLKHAIVWDTMLMRSCVKSQLPAGVAESLTGMTGDLTSAWTKGNPR